MRTSLQAHFKFRTLAKQSWTINLTATHSRHTARLLRAESSHDRLCRILIYTTAHTAQTRSGLLPNLDLLSYSCTSMEQAV